ncbi:unnamed protein product [Orchesella dallaii]|uniref:Retrotransposon gag domain-containing protein n=1 Tax=Orchesella dallaii TaxID=48710 RepID=A0ABP1PIS1_9HEXA
MFLFSKPKALESNREHLTHDEAMTELVANVRGMVENQQHLHTQMNLLKDGQIKHDQKMKNLKLRLKDMTVKMQNSRAITLPPPNMHIESPVNSPIDSPYESDAEEPSAPRAPAENVFFPQNDAQYYAYPQSHNSSFLHPPTLLFDPLSGLSFPQYSPGKMSPDGFFSEVEEFLVLKGIHSSQWHLLVGRMLPHDSDIISWWRANKVKLNSWAKFKAAFRKYESVDSTKDGLTEKLFAKKQKFIEPFESYCWDVANMYRKVSPKIEEHKIIDRIVNSCWPEIAVQLRTSSYQSVDELISHGRILIKNLNRLRTLSNKPLLRIRKTDALPPPKNAYPNGKQQGNRSSQQPQESSSQHANQADKISPPETKQPSTEGNKPKSNAGHTHGNGKAKANLRFCNFCKKPNHTEEACWKKEMLNLINIQQQASPQQMAQASTPVENGHGDRMMWSQFLPPHSSQK